MALTKVSSELIKDNSITIDKMHTGVVIKTSDGLHNNANDTVLPTAGAVVSYVTSQVTGANNWDLSFAWGDHSTYGYATETYVNNSIANVINSAPAALDTLNELAAALGDDPNFATTVSTQIGTAQSTANTALTNANAALAKDPTLTLSGDASGSATFTNLGNATLSVTIADDSHNHIISNIDGLQTALNGKQAAGTYNTIIGTDSDINTSGATIVDNIYVTDGVITSMGTRTLTLGDLGYTGATNANYITNNNQLTNGAGYITFNDTNANSNHLNTTRDTPDNSLQYWQASGLGTTEAPSTDWHNTIRTGHGDPLSYYSNTLAIRMTGTGIGDIYTQTIAGGTAQGWKKHWNSGNDGSGSGLDADLLDGLQGPQFLRSDAADTMNGPLTIIGNGSYLANYGYNTLTLQDSGGYPGLNFRHSNTSIFQRMSAGSTLMQWVYSTNASAQGAGTYSIGMELAGNALYAAGSVKSPVFYDSNNTGYYVDPAGISQLYTIYYNEWVRNTNSSASGLYWEPNTPGNGWHIYPQGRADMTFRTGSGNGGIKGTVINDTARGYIHWTTSSEIGFLNSSRSWSLRVDNSGNTFATGSHRAPIFYDSANTAYYTDPASTSRLNASTSNYVNIAADAAYGVRFWNGSHEYSIRMSQSSNGTYGGRVGGETTSDYNMYFTMTGGTNRGFVFRNSNSSSGPIAGIDASGNGRFEGDVIAFSASDKRLKDNIKPIENALEKVNKISGVEFDWNSNQDTYAEGMHDIGVIAQEIEEVIPEVVKTKDNGYKAVKYEKIVPLLIEAIKEQQTQIEELKQLINKQ